MTITTSFGPHIDDAKGANELSACFGQPEVHIFAAVSMGIFGASSLVYPNLTLTLTLTLTNPIPYTNTNTNPDPHPNPHPNPPQCVPALPLLSEGCRQAVALAPQRPPRARARVPRVHRRSPSP